MNYYPESFKKLVEQFKKIPGIGEKTAERYAISLINFNSKELEDFTKVIDKIKNISKCVNCGYLTDNEYCNICKDKSRNTDKIMIVEDYNSVSSVEKSRNYNGLYHVLGGLISPIDGDYPENLNIKSLIEKVKRNSNLEIIIALKPTIEGETTALYIRKILSEYNIKITRISYGIPINMEIGNLDAVTLSRAISDRKKIE